MKPLVPLSLLLLVLLSGCGSDSVSGPDAATLSGRVTLASTGRGYYPATVALIVPGSSDFRYESTDTEGHYRFRRMEAGRYVLVLQTGQGAFVREVVREPIEIAPGANTRDFVVP